MGALVTVCLGVGLTALGSSIVTITLPQIGHGMHAGLADLQWVANAYTVTYAALLLPAGGLTDRIGRRSLFLGGTAAQAVGSAWCAAAPDLALLLAGRVVQAIGAAAMVPATLALVSAEFPDQRRRARAIGWWAGAASAGLAAGPLAGGVILGVAGWRAAFAVVTLAAAVLLGIGWRLDRAAGGRTPGAGPADASGAVAVTVFLTALSFALIEGGPGGWASPAVLIAFAVAAGSVAAFGVLERRVRRPLMPLTVWRIHQFVAANAGGIAYGAALTGVLFYLSLFLQQVQGRSALDAGLVFLPLTGVMAITGPVAGRLAPLAGQRGMAVAGMTIAAAGVCSLAAVGPRESTAALACRLAVVGLGLGLMSTPLSGAMITALPARSAGFASAMYNSSRQVGSVLGVTLLGVVVAPGQPAAAGPSGLAFTRGLQMAMLAAGLALLASAAAGAALLPGRGSFPPGDRTALNDKEE
jgi:EmrB/QacA subfamily drug resistance transporter